MASTILPEKSVVYDRLERCYRAEFEGRVIGWYANEQAAWRVVNELAYDALTRDAILDADDEAEMTEEKVEGITLTIRTLGGIELTRASDGSALIAAGGCAIDVTPAQIDALRALLVG